MVFTNSHAHNLTTNFEVVDQLGIICTIVDVLHKNTALIWVIACIA